MDILMQRTKDQLAKARKQYGERNQILVAVEELNELACVLTKYPRYDTHEEALRFLKDHVLEECGDVLNALDHVQAIFGITDAEMVEAASHKGDRLARWIEKGDTMQTTTQDRDVPSTPCPLCIYNGADPFVMPCFVCKTQSGYKGFTPKKHYPKD